MSSQPPITNDTLLATVKEIQALCAHCNTTLNSSLDATHTAISSADAPPALRVLRDAAKLLHAHATKIGLLLINDPFTPSAIQKELIRCENECLPGMMGAIEVCHPARWTATLTNEARGRVQAAISAFEQLLLDVSNKCEGKGVKVNDNTQKQKTLASTGQVWQACDALVALEKEGIAGCVSKKACEYRDMLKDAMEELKAWGENEDDQDEGFHSSDREDERDSVEDMFIGRQLPTHRKDLKQVLDRSLKQLKLVEMLFQALTKRRLKTFAIEDAPDQLEAQTRNGRLDGLIAGFKSIADDVDDFAGALYELDADNARIQLDEVVEQATQTATSMEMSWNGASDEFTSWSNKWKDALAKTTK